jgi:hypothetical protein
VRGVTENQYRNNPFSYTRNTERKVSWQVAIWREMRQERKRYGFEDLEEIQIILGRGGSMTPAGKRRTDNIVLLRPGERDDGLDSVSKN